MKKLLSILSIGSILSYSTTVTVSCEETTNKITLDTSNFKLEINYLAYIQIREQIAGQANTTVDYIKNSKDILISIWKNGTDTQLGENDIVESGVTYDVKVSIKNDEYFNNMSLKIQEVPASKIDISRWTFSAIPDTYSNSRVYEDVRGQVAFWANDPAYDEPALAADGTITVEIWQGGVKKEDISSENTISNGATVHITVVEGNNYFATITKNDYQLKFVV